MAAEHPAPRPQAPSPEPAPGRFPLGALRELGELGLVGAGVPITLGGAGGDERALGAVVDELRAADPRLAAAVAAHGAATHAILAHGTPEQLERLVPPLAQGHELATTVPADAVRLAPAAGDRDAAAAADPVVVGPHDASAGAPTDLVRLDPATGALQGTAPAIPNGAVAGVVVVDAGDTVWVARGFTAVRDGAAKATGAADLDFAGVTAERLGP